MCHLQTFAARVLLALVFFGIVILKLIAITSTPDGYLQYQYMLGQLGLPAVFAPLLILIQFVGGLALLIGFRTKVAAITMGLLALFTAIVAAFAALKFNQPLDSFFLYMGIAGGMWLLSIYPDTACSLDNRKK